MNQLPEKNKMVQPPDQVEEIVPPKYNFEDMIN
jgi:membrane protein involved in colicin uptake